MERAAGWWFLILSLCIVPSPALKDIIAKENETVASTGGTVVQIDADYDGTFLSCTCTENMKIAVILTKVVSALSLIGSVYIIKSLLWPPPERRKKLKTTFNRLLLALSFSDVMSSIAFFVGTWAIPRYPFGFGGIDIGVWDSYFPWAAGNDGTCIAQGFFIQFGVMASVFFTGCIAMQYIFTVRCNWTEKRLRMAEKVFFSVSVSIPLITAIASAALGLLNPVSMGFCWIEAWPWYCIGRTGGFIGEWCSENMRSENSIIYRWAFSSVFILLVLVLVIVSMVLLFISVRNQETRAAK